MVGLENLFSERAAPGGGSYRTPVDGLYLCGAGAHPGGGVTGAPGHNAARRMLADMAGERAPAPAHRDQQVAGGQPARHRHRPQLGYQVAQSRLLRGATRLFAKNRK